MRAVLEELGQAEEAVCREKHYQGALTEALRRDPRNNRHIIEAVRHSLERCCG
jgi:hypothetical protein